MFQPMLSLRKQLVEELVQHVVGNDANYWISLSLEMNDGGGGRSHIVALAERDVFIDDRIQRGALGLRADFDHLRWGEYRSQRAIHVAGLFPLLLIGEKR